jgi:hypothetical protein
LSHPAFGLVNPLILVAYARGPVVPGTAAQVSRESGYSRVRPSSTSYARCVDEFPDTRCPRPYVPAGSLGAPAGSGNFYVSQRHHDTRSPVVTLERLAYWPCRPAFRKAATPADLAPDRQLVASAASLSSPGAHGFAGRFGCGRALCPCHEAMQRETPVTCGCARRGRRT